MKNSQTKSIDNMAGNKYAIRIQCPPYFQERCHLRIELSHITPPHKIALTPVGPAAILKESFVDLYNINGPVVVAGVVHELGDVAGVEQIIVTQPKLVSLHKTNLAIKRRDHLT